MKNFHIFLLSAYCALALCSCGRTPGLVILTASQTEYEKCLEYFPDIECICAGVGAGNIIKACCNLPKGTRIINIGYAGSNNMQIGVVTLVRESFRYTTGYPVPEDHANPIRLSDTGVPCYTGNSFFTETDIEEPSLFDMELNYIASFTPRLELVASVKIVSNNLNVAEYENNTMRETGVLTSDEVWLKVKEAVDALCK